MRLVLTAQVGSVNNTFGVPGVEENCFFLKDLAQAKALRKRINDSFEVASLPGTSPEERRRLLTFVVVSPCLVPLEMWFVYFEKKSVTSAYNVC